MRWRVWRRAKKRTALIKGRKTLVLLGREGGCGWEYLSEEGEGEVCRGARDLSFAPWATAARPGGRRPCSVESQANSLFYHEPHHARPAIPLRPPLHHPSEGYEQQSSSEASASNKERQYRTLHHVRSPTWPMSRASAGSELILTLCNVTT